MDAEVPVRGGCSTDTIFAVSTAPGRAGIAVVRISGPKACRAAAAIVGPLPEPRHAAFRRFRDPSGEIFDAGLVLWFAAPRSETGEDVVEFHLHGSRAVTDAALTALGGIDGLRLAAPGEFARRAFANGKLDLTAVEGLADLIEAETTAQRRQALRQLDGALGRLYERWRSELLSLRAVVEAAIDFSDEDDVPADVLSGLDRRMDALAGEMERHLTGAWRGERLRDGAQLVIAGPVNAGKSSLLNALARREVAIVSEIEGTTRDTIEVRLDLGGIPVVAVDTAGLRDSEEPIEAEGIRRARRRLADADLVLWLDAGERACAVAGDVTAPVWRVRSKADLSPRLEAGRVARDGFAVSVVDGRGLDVLIDALADYFRDRFEGGTDAGITRARHREAVSGALEDLKAARARLSEDAGDLAAEELRRGGDRFARLTGRIDVEDVLDLIFRDFCIGK